jgi:hypothetical protein
MMALSRLLVLPLAMLLLPACSTGAVDATYQHELVQFEDFTVAWTGCTLDATTGQQDNPNCQNSNPVILRLDARVRDTETELPVNNVRVWFNSGYELVYLLPQEVLEAIEVPITEGWDDVLGRGEVWAEFAGTFEGDYRPTYHESPTDQNGVASVWLYIQEMPRNETGQASAAQITVSIASDVQIFKLTPAG